MTITTLILSILTTQNGLLPPPPPLKKLADLPPEQILLLYNDEEVAGNELVRGNVLGAREVMSKWGEYAHEGGALASLFHDIELASGNLGACALFARYFYNSAMAQSDDQHVDFGTTMLYARALAADSDAASALEIADLEHWFAKGEFRDQWIGPEYTKGGEANILRDVTLPFVISHATNPTICAPALNQALQKYPDDPELSFLLANLIRKTQPRRALTLMRNATNSKVARIQREAKYQVTCLEWQISKFGDNPPPGG